MLKLFQQFLWAIRRLTIHIPSGALVLEVGSGGNPYPRSNVLLDAYENTQERHWDPLIHDRPTVLTFAENLPFKDKAFDYVIAAHVLEHSPYPEKFLSELQRVAHAGYIETPDSFMERINPYLDHRLEVTLRDDCLVIRKKGSWAPDMDLVELYENRAKVLITRETIPRSPSVFHTRYFWRDKINYRVINPEVKADWLPVGVEPCYVEKAKLPIKDLIRIGMLRLVRKMFSQTYRNSKLDIVPLMRCPRCSGDTLERRMANEIVCADCGAQYIVNQNIYKIHYL